MASAFRNLFESIIAALGGGFDKQPPKAEVFQQFSLYGHPINPATDCRVCAEGTAKPEYDNQFCSYQCEQRMADSLDAWHDQFEERCDDD